MPNRIQDAVNSRLGVGIALAMARIVPRRSGLRLAYFIADRFSRRRQLAMVQAVRLNQYIVGREKLNAHELDELVKQNYRFTARGIFELYRTLGKPNLMSDIVELTPGFAATIERSARKNDPFMVVSAHMNQFDLLALFGAARGANLFALMYPEPGGGYAWQNRIRDEYGVEAYPTTRASLKEAIKKLQSGITVVTAADRPVPGTSQRPTFFGRKAPLPLHYIMLALKADVPIVVAANYLREDGKYEAKVSDPIYMQRMPDRTSQLICNAESVLNKIEEFISLAPAQWSMAYPVWPDFEGQVP